LFLPRSKTPSADEHQGDNNGDWHDDISWGHGHTAKLSLPPNDVAETRTGRTACTKPSATCMRHVQVFDDKGPMLDHALLAHRLSAVFQSLCSLRVPDLFQRRSSGPCRADFPAEELRGVRILLLRYEPDTMLDTEEVIAEALVLALESGDHRLRAAL
jgi:hypothetical protein